VGNPFMIDAVTVATLRIDRAEEHLAAIRTEIRNYLTTNPAEFGALDGPQPLEPTRIHHPPPARLVLLTGDCLSNIRNALEGMFWALSLETGPKDPDRERIVFPMFSNEAKYRAALPGIERNVSIEGLRVLEEVQPFRTRNPSLSVLRGLSNRNRYGLISFTVRGSTTNDHPSPASFVAFEVPHLLATTMESVLSRIVQHVRRDVIPKFEGWR